MNEDAPTEVRQWLAMYANDDNFSWSTSSGHYRNVTDALVDMVIELYDLAFQCILSLQRHAHSDEAAPFLMGMRVDEIGDVLGCAPRGGPPLSGSEVVRTAPQCGCDQSTRRFEKLCLECFRLEGL